MFPPLYHAHHARHPEDLPFWLELAGSQDSPVLELGCGTGRVLLPLAQAGHPVIGLDRDPEMLAFLRTQLNPELSARVGIFQGDLADFRLEAQFPLILLPCNTLSTLPSETRPAALQRVLHHLQPGGLFAASLANPLLLASLPAHSEVEFEESFPHPGTGEPVMVSSGWDRAGVDFLLYWVYDLLLPNGDVQRLTAEIRHDLARPEVYVEELREAGLQVEALYGDFRRAPFRPRSSDNLILLARRP